MKADHGNSLDDATEMGEQGTLVDR